MGDPGKRSECLWGFTEYRMTQDTGPHSTITQTWLYSLVAGLPAA
ncbi:MAG: hypothetical protein ACJAU3_001512 [Zhongshania sp.]